MSPECYSNLKVGDEVKVDIGNFHIAGTVFGIDRNVYNLDIKTDTGTWNDFSYQLVTYLGPIRPVRIPLIDALKELIKEYE
jgi:hypothetical protein